MPTSTGQTSKDIVLPNRKRVKELKAEGLSKSEVKDRLGVGYAFIRMWWDKEDIEEDNRGWPKGKPRIHTEKEGNRVVEIRRELYENNPFYGDEKIAREYRKRHNKEISRWFVDQIIRKRCPHREKKTRGNSGYQNYPEKTILSLGKTIQEIDFVGRKYIEGGSKPVHFLTQNYIQPKRLPKVTRIAARSGQIVINELLDQWREHGKPDVVKMDNGIVLYRAGGGDLAKHRLTRFAKTLLNLDIAPLYIAFGKSWNNGSVEGVNSVFARKVWKRERFQSLEEADKAISKFNCAYKDYLGIKDGELLGRKFQGATPKVEKAILEKNRRYPPVWFIREVGEDRNSTSNGNTGVTKILDTKITLPGEYIGQFVLVKGDVENHTLTFLTEARNGTLNTIKTMSFKFL